MVESYLVNTRKFHTYRFMVLQPVRIHMENIVYSSLTFKNNNNEAKLSISFWRRDQFELCKIVMNHIIEKLDIAKLDIIDEIEVSCFVMMCSA